MRPLPVFDLSGTPHDVAQRWQRWKRSFNYYVKGESVSGASKPQSKMLHLAGMPVQDIFAILTEPVVPRGQTVHHAPGYKTLPQIIVCSQGLSYGLSKSKKRCKTITKLFVDLPFFFHSAKPFLSIAIHKKVKFDEVRCLFSIFCVSKVITTAHAHRKVLILIFCQDLSNKKLRSYDQR